MYAAESPSKQLGSLFRLAQMLDWLQPAEPRRLAKFGPALVEPKHELLEGRINESHFSICGIRLEAGRPKDLAAGITIMKCVDRTQETALSWK